MSEMETNAFDDLLFKAQQLSTEIDSCIELPRIERNLKQLSEAGQDLWTRTASSRQKDTSDVRASVLLGTKGYDLQKVTQSLDNLNASKKISSIETGKSSDIQGLLRYERENAIISVIEEVKNSTFDIIDKQCWQFMLNDWEESKTKILNSLSGPKDEILIKTPFTDTSNRQSFMERSSQLTPGSIPFGQRSLFDKDENAIFNEKVVKVINEYQNDIENLISQVAIDCNNSVLFEASYRLLTESKDGRGLRLLNKHLSSVVPEKRSQNVKRDQLERLAMKLAEKFSQSESNVDKNTIGVLYLILDLITFFDYYHNKTYNDALDILLKLNIIPFRNSEVELRVNEFGQFTDEIRKNIPHILLAAMNILYSQHKEMKNSTQTVTKFGVVFDVNNRDQICMEIRQKAKSLITYAGMLPYRMPGDTNARLVQLEVLMS